MRKRSPIEEECRQAALAEIKSRRAQEVRKRVFCSDDEEWQNQIGNDLMDWSNTDEAMVLDTFPLSRYLSPSRFYKIAEKNPYFAQCLEYARAKLGEKMELKIKDNPIHISKALPIYSTLWIEAEDRKNKSATPQLASVAYYAPTWKIDDKGEKVEVVAPPK